MHSLDEQQWPPNRSPLRPGSGIPQNGIVGGAGGTVHIFGKNDNNANLKNTRHHNHNRNQNDDGYFINDTYVQPQPSSTRSFVDQQRLPKRHRSMDRSVPLLHHSTISSVDQRPYHHQKYWKKEKQKRPQQQPINNRMESDLIPSQFGTEPITVQCPFCARVIRTRIRLIYGSCVWMCFVVMLLSGFLLFLPWLCCWIPLYRKSFRDVEHECPECSAKLGIYRR